MAHHFRVSCVFMVVGAVRCGVLCERDSGPRVKWSLRILSFLSRS